MQLSTLKVRRMRWHREQHVPLETQREALGQQNPLLATTRLLKKTPLQTRIRRMGALPCIWTLLSGLGENETFSTLLEPPPI